MITGGGSQGRLDYPHASMNMQAVVPEGQGKSSGATVWCMRELEEIVEEHGLSEDIDYLALLHSRMRENARRASATRGNPVELHEDEAELLPGGVPMQQQGPSAPGSSGSCPPGRRNNKLHPSSQSISQTSSTIPAQWESRRSLCGVM